MPRPRRVSTSRRSQVNLDTAGGLTRVVASRRAQLFADFGRWATGELSCDSTQVCATGLLLGTALVAFGKFLFYSGSPKYTFSETINACCDRFKHYRTFFGAAWGVLSRWEEEEPVERSFIPVSVFKAAVCVALVWNWPVFAAGLLIGFNALLRPGEFLLLKRRDLILPRDVLSDLPLAYVRILGGKTKRFMQRQHAKISGATTVVFLDKLFGEYSPTTSLSACSPNVFRRRRDAVFKQLGVPNGDTARGITPKCLRGSGATWMYQLTEDIGRIQWRGRGQPRRTLGRYLQDVAGQLLLVELAESHRLRIRVLSSWCSTVLKNF